MAATRAEGDDELEDEAPPVAFGTAAATEANPGPTFPVGPPFGLRFFRTVLKDRVREHFGARPENVPVVQLRLADGTTYDVCQIEAVERRWLAIEAYRDPETCEDTDLVFIPYETVTRVMVSDRPQRERPIGFRVGG